MPAASVPTRRPAAPKLELVPAPRGGMGLAANCPVQKDSLAKAVPGAVIVTTLMAVTLSMDTAYARLAGQVHAASCPALPASGG